MKNKLQVGNPSPRLVLPWWTIWKNVLPRTVELQNLLPLKFALFGRRRRVAVIGNIYRICTVVIRFGVNIWQEELDYVLSYDSLAECPS
jgi:hypothetical protein